LKLRANVFDKKLKLAVSLRKSGYVKKLRSANVLNANALSKNKRDSKLKPASVLKDYDLNKFG
jgi:hypothetical protein